MDYLLIVSGILLNILYVTEFTNSTPFGTFILSIGLCCTIVPFYSKLSKIEATLKEQQRLLNKPSKDKDVESEDVQNKKAEDD